MSFPTNKELEEWPVTEPPTEAEIGRGRSRAVELGGQAFGIPHSARSTFFDVMEAPAPDGALWTPKIQPGTSPIRIMLASCGEYAMFNLPLDHQKGWQGTQPTQAQKDANATRMCVVDDSAHLWPRFQ